MVCIVTSSVVQSLKRWRYNSPFVGCCCYSVHALGSHFITVLFNHGAVSTFRMPLLTDACDNWGYDEGRSMRFPSGLNGPCSNGGGFIGRSRWTTHTSKTINLFTNNTTRCYNSHYCGGLLKVPGYLTLLLIILLLQLSYYHYCCSYVFILNALLFSLFSDCMPVLIYCDVLGVHAINNDVFYFGWLDLWTVSYALLIKVRTGNTMLSLIYTIYSTPLHMH
jgi:hypothetical protein